MTGILKSHCVHRFPIAIAVLLTSIMYVWNWGSRLKSVHISNKQVAPELFFAAGEESLRLQWSDTPIARVPGIGFYFSDASSGLPPVLQAIFFFIIIIGNHAILSKALYNCQCPSRARRWGLIQ